MGRRAERRGRLGLPSLEISLSLWLLALTLLQIKPFKINPAADTE